ASPSSPFVTVATINEVLPGTGRIVEVEGIWVALFNVDGTFYAIDNTCPHAGGPLGEGRLDGTIVECPWHGWKFDVTSGERLGNPDFRVTCCTVRVHGNEVQIAIPPTLRKPA
ncbi:MAG: Rieske (2Fe-2S) protein, partial [Nitrospira sp.]